LTPGDPVLHVTGGASGKPTILRRVYLRGCDGLDSHCILGSVTESVTEWFAERADVFPASDEAAAQARAKAKAKAWMASLKRQVSVAARVMREGVVVK
jgi:hypothetical protein